jgi:hypothetical protein
MSPFDRDDSDEHTAPPPPIRVTAHLKGGPADGETRLLPWALIKLPVMSWDGDMPVESVYRMGERWLHQRDVDYVFVDPAPASMAPPARPARRAQRVLRAARDAWRRAA